MTDRTTPLTFDLQGNGGAFSLTRWRAFEKWLAAERVAWEWMTTAPRFGPVVDMISNGLNRLQGEGDALKASGGELSSLQASIQEVFGPNNQSLLYSGGAAGSRVIEIKELASPEAAAFAYALARQQVTIGQTANLEQARGAFMLAVPEIDRAKELDERLTAERANTRQLLRSGLAELEQDSRDRNDEWDAEVTHQRDIARRWRARAVRLWKLAVETNEAAESARNASVHDAVASIKAVEASYREAMGLQAPVEYWTKKAVKHGEDEGQALIRLYWFFPLAGLLLVVSFSLSAWALLANEKSDIHSAVYFIVSGGLASLAALAFWVGRILTKLYLSEHHLRHDAEERAVMTTTYLALTREQAAADVDRQIILTALFRSTPDGIVREDGPGDPSIPAMLARLGTGGR